MLVLSDQHTIEVFPPFRGPSSTYVLSRDGLFPLSHVSRNVMSLCPVGRDPEGNSQDTSASGGSPRQMQTSPGGWFPKLTGIRMASERLLQKRPQPCVQRFSLAEVQRFSLLLLQLGPTSSQGFFHPKVRGFFHPKQLQEGLSHRVQSPTEHLSPALLVGHQGSGRHGFGTACP